MIYSAWATERTKAHIEGRAEKAALMNWNGKPYRTAQGKAMAKRTAYKCADGAWRSGEPVNYHPMPR